MYPVKISVITPVFEPNLMHLEECVRSVSAFRDSVEHILVFDGENSTNEIVKDYYSSFPNLLFFETSNHGGISAASNFGSSKASGEYLLFLDQDDFLLDGWYEYIVENLETETDFAYSDTITCTENGLTIEQLTFNKPKFSPVRLLGNMYACHFMLVKKIKFELIGGFRTEFDGSQDHDLALRLLMVSSKFQHLPKSLYAWRQSDKSTALNPSAKAYAVDSGIKAVQSYLKQKKIPAVVSSVNEAPGFYSLSFESRKNPISTIIPTAFTRGKMIQQPLIYKLFKSLINQLNDEDEIILVVDERFDTRIDISNEILAKTRIIRDPNPFNFSNRINIGALEAKHENLLFLNDDVLLTDNSINQIFGYLENFSHLGVVGIQLLDSEGLITHGGHIYTGGGPLHAYVESADLMGYFGDNLIDREVSGVAGAVMGTKKELWDSVGGFSVKFPNNFNDVDFCLKINSLGKDILIVNSARGYHDESSTRIPTVMEWEIRLLKRRWNHKLNQDYYTRCSDALKKTLHRMYSA